MEEFNTILKGIAIKYAKNLEERLEKLTSGPGRTIPDINSVENGIETLEHIQKMLESERGGIDLIPIPEIVLDRDKGDRTGKEEAALFCELIMGWFNEEEKGGEEI